MIEETEYTGAVTPGGAAQVRELEHLTIRKMAVSEMSNNVYLLTCRSTGEQLLIDAADDAPRCLELVALGGQRLAHIVTTHRHWDHVRALAEVAEETGARTYAGADDADHLPVAPDVPLEQGDRIRCGEVELEVSVVRGHTPGSVVLAYAAADGSTHLFTGDTLFPGGVGATDRYDYQDFETLYQDVVERIFEVYDDRTWFYPGHGDDSTLAAERPELDSWRERGW